jgi:hypothetical protein
MTLCIVENSKNKKEKITLCSPFLLVLPELLRESEVYQDDRVVLVKNSLCITLFFFELNVFPCHLG